MHKIQREVDHYPPKFLGRRSLIHATSGREGSNERDRDRPGSELTRLPASSVLLSLGTQSQLIELFPMAAYAVRAPDGVIAWFNSGAAELWGRIPVLGDTDERFCGAYKL